MPTYNKRWYLPSLIPMPILASFPGLILRTGNEASLYHAVMSNDITYYEYLAYCSDSGRLTFLKETTRSPEYLSVTTGKLYHSLCQ